MDFDLDEPGYDGDKVRPFGRELLQQCYVRVRLCDECRRSCHSDGLAVDNVDEIDFDCRSFRYVSPSARGPDVSISNRCIVHDEECRLRRYGRFARIINGTNHAGRVTDNELFHFRRKHRLTPATLLCLVRCHANQYRIDWHEKISNSGKMVQSTSSAALLSISLDRNLKEPLHAQLAGHLRRLILDRRFEAAERLPSSRMLADELSISRVTVTTAFDQLISEGYAEGRQGSGVYVAADLPGYTFSSDRGSHGAIDDDGLPVPKLPIPFETSAPDLQNFPHREWARIVDQVWRSPEPSLLAKPDLVGWGPLRRAIASHLNDWRGVQCAPSQIVITSGLVEAVELTTKAALAAGDTVMVEDPGHRVLRNALLANRLVCKPVPVDENGFNIQASAKLCRNARAVFVTPSRQYPLGMTLPLARRLELLEWAVRTKGLIIEDDFDSEYRYVGQPLPALMSLDDQECVIYVGSFSKVLLPTLRLGFVVFPKRLISNARDVMGSTGPRTSFLAQPPLQQFIETGGFATHIRRMRRLYAQRQKTLVAALQHHAKGLLRIEPASGGMHIVAELAPKLVDKMTDIEVAERINAVGISVSALSTYFAGRPTQQGLVLGYAGFDEDSIQSSAVQLANALKRRI